MAADEGSAGDQQTPFHVFKHLLFLILKQAAGSRALSGRSLTGQTGLLYLHPARESAPEPQGGGSAAGHASALASGGGRGAGAFQRSGFGRFGRRFWRRRTCSAVASVKPPMWWVRDVQLSGSWRSLLHLAAGGHRISSACGHDTVCSVRALKSWYAGPMFRYGRLRRPAAAVPSDRGGATEAEGRSGVEVIALAWDLLASLGVGGQLELNSLGTSEDRRAPTMPTNPGQSSDLGPLIPILRRG